VTHRARWLAAAPRVLAVGVALVAIAGIISAITPSLHNRSEVLGALVPREVRSVAFAFALAASVALLIVAGGLRRRRRRSWQVGVLMLASVAALHVAKGLDVEEAAASLVLLVALFLSEEAFDVAGDPETPRAFLRHAAAAGLGLAVLGGLLIEGQSALAGGRLSPLQALVELAHEVAGLGPGRLNGRGAHAIPRALATYALVATVWLLFLWLKPRRSYLRQHARDRLDARRLVEAYGTDTLDYFALRRDKLYFFDRDRSAFLAYTVAGGVALVSGDPIGEEPRFDALLAAFLAEAHRFGWRVAAIGVGPAGVPRYEAAGLRTIYIGDEAIVDPRTFSLDGRPIRKVRQSVSRLAKAGYETVVLRRDELDVTMLSGLLRVSDLWLGGQPERGFSMAMDDIWAPEHGAAVFAIAVTADGQPHGFVHFVPVPGARSLSLSAMRRLPDTPNGLMEFLLCGLFAWAGERGEIEQVSLNFSAFGELMRAETADLPRWERVAQRSLSRADRYFQVERLLTFNRKFFPSWAPRYATFERRRDLPLAMVVLLTAERLVEIPQPLIRFWRRILPRRS
jgi:lysyl-tRNA synthetase class 2